MDNAPASGAGNPGSIPGGGINIIGRPSYGGEKMSRAKSNHYTKIFIAGYIFLFGLILILSGCADFCNPTQPYLVLYAFDDEGRLLAGEMTNDRTDTLLGREVFIGKLAGKEIVLAESGVGMTNAAMTVQKMIDTYDPKAIIFSGIAGGIDSSVHIGDIVVPEKWATHDYGYYGADSFVISGIDIVKPDVDTIIEKMYFAVDDSLLAAARKLSHESLGLDSIGSRIPRLIVGGIGVSGDSFIDQVEKRLWLSDHFAALTTDMETAAVAQVCTVNGVPFIGFRSASDLAGGSGSESARTEIGQFFQVAANNSAQVVVEFLKIL
jgi:adenosylhomocysteine nucleosidase